MSTAWLLVAGTQIAQPATWPDLRDAVSIPLQLAIDFLSAAVGGGRRAQEKDRRTLVLLLLTNLTNSEIVLGKLLAAMLNVLVLLAASLPLFMLTALFGGVSFEQIARVFAVSLATVLVAGSLGSTIALAREKTFQPAMTVLSLLVGSRRSVRGSLGELARPAQDWAAAPAPGRRSWRPRDRSLKLKRSALLGNAINLFLPARSRRR
jgi:hypothetical protein